jgi:hypothetical protein
LTFIKKQQLLRSNIWIDNHFANWSGDFFLNLWNVESTIGLTSQLLLLFLQENKKSPEHINAQGYYPKNILKKR